ncbi:MAG: protein FlhF [Desulfobacteraceae bacterium]
MNKQVFQAPNIQEAMASVKEALGPEAMILSTRKVPKSPRDPYGKDMIEVEASLGQDSGTQGKSSDVSGSGTELKDELMNIKDMISIAGLGYGMHNIICEKSHSVKLLASLLRAGVSEKKAYSIIHKASHLMEADLEAGLEADSFKKYVMKECIRWVETVDFFRRDNNSTVPHVAAFVGPTGVGKTTTIAKLAAKLSLKDKKRVGLVSVDNYRIGAFEQLKAYASIMGLYCVQAYTREDLVCALDRMKSMDVVLVDTAGHSHFDKERMDELAGVIKNDGQISVHLVLSATADFVNMKESVESFSVMEPNTYVFTKTDETKVCGKILDQVSEFKLPVSLVTNGQKVPEDLIVPDRKKLLGIILGKERDEN